MGTNRKADKKLLAGRYDHTVTIILFVLICFGLVMLYSTSYYSAQLKFEDDLFYFKKQVRNALISFAVLFVISKLEYHLLVRLAPLWLLGSYGLMALVKFSPMGVESYGAKRWLQVPVVGTVQPSELTKIAMILMIAYLVCKKEKDVNSIKGILGLFFWAILSSVLTLYLTDHLSAAIIIFGICFIMVFVVTNKYKSLGFLAVGGIAAAVAGARFLAERLETSGNFRLVRLLMWVNPEKYLDDGGRQIIQGLYAIGSGGFFGKGLGNSSQKLGFIPEAQNDWILSIICEELGVFGVIILLSIFAMLLRELMKIAKEAPDLSGALIVTGIFSHIALQVVLNVCVVINLIPATGITLPFISYGGSALMITMGEMGLALSVYRASLRQKIKEEQLGDLING
ncbi:MAG: putative peptidoglycan glycosyltransferase FtsW [Clostridiales bacterium]|nr:putative peptidoglycan glycosyltransferase FtsW [Clostridiales bacterium]